MQNDCGDGSDEINCYYSGAFQIYGCQIVHVRDVNLLILRSKNRKLKFTNRIHDFIQTLFTTSYSATKLDYSCL